MERQEIQGGMVAAEGGEITGVMELPIVSLLGLTDMGLIDVLNHKIIEVEV